MEDSTLAALRHNPSQTIRLYPSKAKWTLMVIVCAACVAIGVLMINGGDALGWLPAIFFGIGLPVAVLQLTGHAHHLIIEPDGFTLGTVMRTRRFAWRDIEEIRIMKMHGVRFVGFRVRGEPESALTRANRATMGIDGMVGDNFGIDVDELAEIFARRIAPSTQTNWPR